MASLQTWQPQNETCSSIDLGLFLHYSLIPSVTIIVVLSCLEKRPRRSPVDEKWPLLNRRCGIVVSVVSKLRPSRCFGPQLPQSFVIGNTGLEFWELWSKTSGGPKFGHHCLRQFKPHLAKERPLDFAGAFKDRWSLGFAFGATANKVMIMFSEGYPPLQMVPQWAQAIVLLVGATEVGLSSYPFFACLSTRSQIAGPALGFLYTGTWFAIMNMHIIPCPQGQVAGPYEKVIFYWPSLLCLVFLLGRFAYKFVNASWVRLQRSHLKEETSFLEVHQAHYVRQLMRKPLFQQPQKSWIQRKVYEWDPYFHFPSRMISTAMLAIICLYMFVVIEQHVYRLVLHDLRNVQAILEELTASSNLSSNTSGPVAGIQMFTEYINITEGVWMFTTFSAFLMCVSYVFHILACYRKHMKRLWTGQKQFLPLESGTPSSSECVAAIARYSGWQIAYILWGYLILHIVQYLFGMLFMYSFVLPIKHGHGIEMLKSLGTGFLTVTIVVGLVVMQIMTARSFFLQPKILPGDKEKPLALDNRKAFHNFSYFLFFYNVLLGVSACLLRLLSSVLVGAWLIARIDRTIMPKGYEAADAGFRTWIRMLFMDHYHTNPTLVCFCHILVVATGVRQQQKATDYHNFSEITDYRISSKARTRWLLLYTLLNNPSLSELRKPKS